MSKIAFRPNFFEIGLFGIRLRECWNAESCDEEHHALLCLGTHSTDTACYWLPYDLFFSKILSICIHSSPVMVRYGMSFVSSKFRYCICKLFTLQSPRGTSDGPYHVTTQFYFYPVMSNIQHSINIYLWFWRRLKCRTQDSEIRNVLNVTSS